MSFHIFDNFIYSHACILRLWVSQALGATDTKLRVPVSTAITAVHPITCASDIILQCKSLSNPTVASVVTHSVTSKRSVQNDLLSSFWI